MEDTTIKPVAPEKHQPKAEKSEKEDLVQITIDREMTDGGIRVNGKLFVGNIKVPQEQADDLMRIQEEYYETKKKLIDKNVNVRMKSDFQKESLFLADPSIHEGKKGWTRDYGMLGLREFTLCSPKFKEYLLEQRRMLYGY